MKEFLGTKFGRKVIALTLAGCAFAVAAFVKDPESRMGLIGLGGTLAASAASLGGKAKDE